MDFKRRVVKKILNSVSRFLTSGSDNRIRKISSLLSVLVPKKDRPFFKRINQKLKDGDPQYLLYKRILVESNENFRDRIINNLLINGAVLNQSKRTEALRAGEHVPTTVLMSPTMRCNLSCKGCYAKSYSRDSDLELETIDSIIKEGKELGVAFFTILGGEPFIREDMTKIYEKHNDIFFLIYTNGTLLNKEKIKEISDLGNVMLMMSIEGSKEETDERRQKGVYKKIIDSMKLLKESKIPFGYSVTVTTHNIKTVTSEKFIDFMIGKGAVVGWYFLYMPVGNTFDLSLMPDAKQRLYLKEKVNAIRKTKPLFAIDFWSDAPFVGGCIAGNRYIHINHKGDIEPCIFTHFAQKNIKDCSIKEAMDCQYFKEIRKRQPYCDNLYRPCMLIDNPEVSRELYSTCNIYPTHKGAERLLTDICGDIDDYSGEVKEVFDKVWSKEGKEFRNPDK